jgi:2-dehydropantoate 2-reductase
MRVCVFGAGAVGGNLALNFALGGADVSVVARGAHLQAMRDRGITVSWKGQTRRAAVRATDDPAELGTQDVVVVTLKAVSIAGSAHAIAGLIGPHTSVVFAVNGLPWWYAPRQGGALAMLDPEGSIAAVIPRRHVVGGVIHVTATIASPGEVALEGPLNGLILGEPDGGLTARLEAIAAPLRAAGLAADVTGSIGTAIWQKLGMNHASSPLAALAGAGLSTLFSDPVLAQAARDLLAESAAIAAAEGFVVTNDADLYLERASKLSHKTSMLLDMEAGRSIEHAAILEAPLEVARRHGVATPVLALVTALLRPKARKALLF